MSYDTIIIGAGLSGLAAGIRLAYYDKKVCILEKHTTIGGLNSFYRLRGRNHDVGLHAVTNYVEPGTKKGPLSKLLRQLRFRWDDFALCPQVGSSVVFPGRRLDFTNDISLLLEEVAREFPQQSDGFRRFVEELPDYEEIESLPSLSAREVLGRFVTDPVLVDMLFCPLMYYGSPTPHDMDFRQFVIMFRAVYLEGFSRPHQGVRPLMKLLVRRFRELGGELKLRTGVERIESENGTATGVTLTAGEFLPAANVLSSAGLVETLRLCDQLPEMAPSYAPGAISFAEAIFSLDCEPASIGIDKTIIFYNLTDHFIYDRPEEPLDLNSGIACSPNNFHFPAPLDEGRVRITALANPNYWMNASEEEYLAAKQSWCDRMRESARIALPDFANHITDVDIFTPRTIKKFTGHLNGCVYGAPEKLRDGRTPLDHLYLIGTDQGYLGIIGSMLSGITVANLYCMQ